MDGLQLQQRLHTLGSKLPVVLISAYANASVAARAMTDGAVAFIEKPYKDDALADAVHKAMDQNRHFGQSPAQQAGQQGG